MKNFIAGNWKMNKTMQESKAYLEEFVNLTNNIDDLDIALFVPFTSLATAVEICKGTKVKIGAQNMHFEEKGAFTGEVSSAMLQELNVEYVLVGHSERRQYFGETDKTVNLRTKAALNGNFKVVVCIGETLEQRENNITEHVLQQQLEEGLKDISLEQAKSITIAYEPVWAIGTGVTASTTQAQDAHNFVRKTLTNIFNEDVANDMVIQYGGSAKPNNIFDLINCPDINGALVGGASLNPQDFSNLLNEAKKNN